MVLAFDSIGLIEVWSSVPIREFLPNVRRFQKFGLRVKNGSDRNWLRAVKEELANEKQEKNFIPFVSPSYYLSKIY